MHKSFLKIAALLGGLAVALGAFGAHGLKQYVDADAVSTFDTGVRYQFYHVFALLIAAVLFKEYPSKWIRYAGNSFLAGITLFSGSLYVLTLLNATGTVGLRGIGIITPFGGIFLILGWLFLFIAIGKGKTNGQP